MIDLEKAIKEFDKYTSNYNPENIRIKRKIVHTANVVKLSKEVSTKLNLNNEDIQIAELIALLHDFGRFEQVRIYDTFSDRDSIDHADLGVSLLFDNNLIRNYIEDTKYDNIIYKAIKNHNKYKIEEGLTNRELMHCKLIRDIDKIDILDGIVTNNKTFYNADAIKNEYITNEVFLDIMKKQCVNRKYVNNNIDKVISYLGFVMDINYKESIEIIKQRGYIEMFVNDLQNLKPETQEKIKQVVKIVYEKIEG